MLKIACSSLVHMGNWTGKLFSFLLLASFTLQSALAAAVFAPISLDQAKAQAAKDNKLVLVDFTASWCGPCHRMEQDTWSDPEVQKWVGSNAIALQLDVDKEKAVSESFQIRAMPSVVVFRGSDYSKEYDRHVGYMSASDLLKWMAVVRKGGTYTDMLKEDLDAVAGKGGVEERKARLAYGRALSEKGNLSAACEHFLWLWNEALNQHPDDMLSLLMFPGRDIAILCARNPEARKSFQDLRDKAEKDGQIIAFAVLNEILRENQKTLDWYDRVKADPAEKEKIQKVEFVLEKLLIDKNRWAELCRLYPDPLLVLKARAVDADKFREELVKKGVSEPPDPLPEDLAVLYAGLLAAGKESEARKFAAECLKIRKTDKMKKLLVSTALKARQPRKDQIKWAAGDANLSAKLKEMLLENQKGSSKNSSKKTPAQKAQTKKVPSK